MKKAWIIVFLAILFQPVYGQYDLLSRKISVNAQQESIENILSQITLSYGILFSYNPEIIPSDSTINLKISNGSVERVLQGMLPSDQFEYKVVSRSIIILPGKNYSGTRELKKQKYQISGLVIDRYTGERIASATVHDIHKLKSALTDSEGKYDLMVHTKEQDIKLSISKKGYWDTIIFIRPDRPEEIPLSVSLSPKPRKVDYIPNRDINELPQYNNIAEIGIVRSTTPKSVDSYEENLEGFKQSRVGQISVIPTIGTNRKMDLMVENNLSFNLFAGYSFGTKGVEVGGLMNMVRTDVEGLQFAGFGNIVGRQVDGVQVAGFFNNCVGKVNGVQFAGWSNLVLDTLKGIQFAGFVNVVHGKVKGIQFAGFTNVVTRSVDGIQLAGFANVALDSAGKTQIAGFANYGKHLRGLQASGFTNVNVGKGVGIQFAGFANVNYGNFDGVQASGFINVAGKVRGSQFGIINIADSISGTAIGILSFVRKGYHEIELYNTELTYANVGFKTGTRSFYNIISCGKGQRENTRIWTYGYGIGRSQKLIKDLLYLDVDLTVNMVNFGSGFNTLFSMYPKINTGLSFRVAGPLYLFATVTYNYYIYDPLMAVSDHVIPGKLLTSPGSKYSLKNWCGYSVGLRI